MQRVADYIAEFCVKEGVSDIFLVSGGGMMHILDGLACNDKINVICAHHEGAAAVMAEGYSRVTGNLGIVMVTTGPGGTNAITGVVDAWVDSTPMLVISGQAKRSQNIYNSRLPLRNLGGQEVNIVPIVESFTKCSVMVNEPTLIRYHLERAVYYAKRDRPGPAWLDIPLDVQAAMIDPDKLESFIPCEIYSDKRIRDTEKGILEVVDALKTAKRPVIVAGQGIRLAHAEIDFLNLINDLKIPVVVSKLGQDLIQYDDPYFVGLGGTKGSRAGNFALQNADLILAIGSRLAIPFTGYEYDLFGKNAKKIAVDVDPIELRKGTINLDIAVQCDAKYFIQILRGYMAHHRIYVPKKWVERCQSWKKRYPPVTEEMIKTANPVSIYDFFDKLSSICEENTVLVADAGSSYFVASQAFRVKYGQRIIIPAALGTMGFSVPMAIGAHYAAPDKQVIAVTGDGSLQMNIQELQTIFHNKIPIKLFVINNGEYASIRNTQNAYFQGRLCGSDKTSGVSCPELDKIAFAYQIPYMSITEPTMMIHRLKVALQHTGPIIIEVFTDPNQQIIPAVSSKVLPDGTMVSTSIEDMYPFLPRDVFEKEMES
jgi:acetolactate synthase I/II/III large subunit